MSLFSWFDKKDNATTGSGECTVSVPGAPAPDCYTKAEVDAIRAEFKNAISELNVRLVLNIVKHDDLFAEVRADILALDLKSKAEYITPEQLNFVVDAISKEIERVESTRAAIVDPAPFSPPMGWMNALQQEVDMRVDSLKAYVDDSVAAYAVNEDAELEEKLANLSPMSAEEIDALYMDEQEATTVAQKTLNGFRVEMYNKAVTDLKILTSARPTIAAVKAFLVKFVESMKPV
jgi:hypothetical protein